MGYSSEIESALKLAYGDDYVSLEEEDDEIERALAAAYGPEATPEEAPTEFHPLGAAKSAFYETVGGLAEAAPRAIGAIIPGEDAFEEQAAAVKSMMERKALESPDVVEFRNSVQRNTESIFGQAIAASGHTVAGMGLSTIPFVGPYLAGGYFFFLNKDEIKDMSIQKGADLDTAETIANIGGAVNSLLDMTGIGFIMRTFKPAGGLSRALMGLVGATLVEGGTEGAQSVIASISSEWAAKDPTESTEQFSTRIMDMMPSILRQAGVEASIGAILGGVMGGGGHIASIASEKITEDKKPPSEEGEVPAPIPEAATTKEIEEALAKAYGVEEPIKPVPAAAERQKTIEAEWKKFQAEEAVAEPTAPEVTPIDIEAAKKKYGIQKPTFATPIGIMPKAKPITEPVIPPKPGTEKAPVAEKIKEYTAEEGQSFVRGEVISNDTLLIKTASVPKPLRRQGIYTKLFEQLAVKVKKEHPGVKYIEGNVISDAARKARERYPSTIELTPKEDPPLLRTDINDVIKGIKPAPEKPKAEKAVGLFAIEKRQAEMDKKYASLKGRRVKDATGQEWEFQSTNDLGVPYFSKVKNDKVQKKEYTVSEFDRAWADKTLAEPAVEITGAKEKEVQYATREEAGAPMLTLEAIQSLPFTKPGTVLQHKDGTFSVSYPGNNGFSIESVESITPDEVLFKTAYGQERKPSRKIAGSYTHKDKTVRIVKGKGDKWIVTHEFEHFLEASGLLSRKEIKAIELQSRAFRAKSAKKFWGTEGRARWVEHELQAREQARGSVIGRIVQKIADILDGFVNVFTQTGRGALRAVETGKAALREGVEVEGIAEAQYAVSEEAIDKDISGIATDIAWDKQGFDWSKEGLKDLASRAYTRFVMREYPVIREAKKAGPEAVAKLERQIQRMRGKGGVVEAILTAPNLKKVIGELKKSGITEYDEITQSLKDALEPIKEKSVYQDYERLRVYERMVALAKFRPDIKFVDAEKAQKVIDLLKEKYGETKDGRVAFLSEISDKHREFERQAILRPLVNIGWMSEERYKDIISKPEAEYYASFLREMEDIETHTVGKGADPVKRIVGSERRIIPSVEGTIANIQRTVRLVESQRLNKQFIALRELSDDLAESIQEKKAPGKPIMPPKGTITIGEKGVKKFFTVPPDVKEVLESYSPHEMSTVIQILGAPARLLRAGATLSAEFMVRNPLRDQFTAMVYSKYGYNPFTDFARGAFHLLGQTDLYNEFKVAGGEQSYFVSLDRQSVNVTAKNIAGYKKRGLDILPTLNPVEALRMFSSFMEKGTRLGLYSKAKQKGATPLQAMAESREGTLDFGRIGKERALNQIIAFWNANVQGTDKLVRETKTNPGKVLLRAGLGITLPSILLWFINKDDERYKALPEWQKNFFWVIPLGDDGPIIRIPKPFELGLIFGSLPERILDYINKNDPKEIKSIAKAIKDGAMPGLIPTAALPFIEHITNYSFFRERQLESLGIQRLPEGKRYTPFTTKIAKEVGGMTDVSPIKLENWVKGWGGTLGYQALQLMDEFLPEDAPEVGKNWYEQVPGLKGMIARDPFGSASKHVNDFYKNLEETTQAEAGHKLLKRSNPEEARKFHAENALKIRSAKKARDYSKKLSVLRKRQTVILNNKAMTSDEKRKRIDEIGKKISDTALRFNQWYLNRKEGKQPSARATRPGLTRIRPRPLVRQRAPTPITRAKPLTLRRAKRITIGG